jgi:hypothetical protein
MTQNKMLPPDTGKEEQGRNDMQQKKDWGGRTDSRHFIHQLI